MSNMIVFFAIIALVGILYVMFYNQYVLPVKLNKLNMANEFRYGRKQNAELIQLLTKHAPHLQNSQNTLNGLSYDTIMDNLQNTRDKVYTTTTFKILVGKAKKANSTVAAKLKAELDQQIKFHHELKASFNKIVALPMAA